MKQCNEPGDSLWTICADAASVFDKIEDLASDYFVDWHLALQKYSDEILDLFLAGQKPTLPVLISIASKSMESTITDMNG